MLAAQLDERLFDVSVFEKNAAPGRKFLVAGDGGFNLTHSEDMAAFVQRYTPPDFLEKALHEFSPADLRAFLAAAGIPTFTGTSGRIFPEKGIKPIDVLNAFLELLRKKHVRFFLRHEWRGWENDALVFFSAEQKLSVRPDYTVFALGGASWSVTGSDGKWTSLFAEKGIRIVPFEASNCAMRVQWPEAFLAEAEGAPLKNIVVHCGEKEKRGELVITRNGLEGGAVYFHSPCIRQQLAEKATAIVLIDFRPDLPEEEIKMRLAAADGKTRNAQLKNLGLGKAQLALLRHFSPKAVFLDDAKMAALIKSFPLTITGLAPLNEAISSAGGIARDETGPGFSLVKLPGTFAIGEMLDWDAPTGGYLLQACFSMGALLAHSLNRKKLM